MTRVLMILSAVCLILGIYNWTLKQENRNLRNRATFYYRNQNLLTTKLQRSYRHNATLQSQNNELSELAKNEKGFDWNYDISASPVLKRLQKD